VDEFGFGDQEGHAYVSAPRGYVGEEPLQAAYVAPIGGGGHRDGEVVNVTDHEALGYQHV